MPRVTPKYLNKIHEQYYGSYHIVVPIRVWNIIRPYANFTEDLREEWDMVIELNNSGSIAVPRIIWGPAVVGYINKKYPHEQKLSIEPETGLSIDVTVTSTSPLRIRI